MEAVHPHCLKPPMQSILCHQDTLCMNMFEPKMRYRAGTRASTRHDSGQTFPFVHMRQASIAMAMNGQRPSERPSDYQTSYQILLRAGERGHPHAQQQPRCSCHSGKPGQQRWACCLLAEGEPASLPLLLPCPRQIQIHSAESPPNKSGVLFAADMYLCKEFSSSHCPPWRASCKASTVPVGSAIPDPAFYLPAIPRAHKGLAMLTNGDGSASVFPSKTKTLPLVSLIAVSLQEV